MPFSPGKTAAFIVFFSPFIFTSGFVRVSTKKTRICRRNSDDTKGDDVYWRQFAKGVDKERVKKVASGKSKGRKKLPKSKNRSNVREKHSLDRGGPRNGAYLRRGAGDGSGQIGDIEALLSRTDSHSFFQLPARR